MTAATLHARRLRAALALLALAAGIALLLLALVPLAGPGAARAAEAPDLMERGRWKEARALLVPRVAAHPDDAEAAWLMSRVLDAFRDVPGALKLAEHAVALDGKDARYHEQLAMVVGESAQRANPLKQLGLAHRFRKEAEAAVALDPRRFEAQDGLLEFFLMAPGIAGGSKDKARDKAEEIAKLDPLKGAYARARIALANHDSTGALAQYHKAVEFAPGDYGARITLAGACAAHNDAAGAEREALEARRIDAGRVGAYVVLAAVRARQQRWAELDSTLAEAERNVPGNLAAHYQAARILVADRHEPAQAELLLRRYLTVEPEGGNPPWSGAHWRLGQALELEGRKPEAIAEVELAVRQRPDFEDAKKDLKRMKKRG